MGWPGKTFGKTHPEHPSIKLRLTFYQDDFDICFWGAVCLLLVSLELFYLFSGPERR